MAWITDNLRGVLARLNPFGAADASPVGYNVFTHQLALAAYMSSGMLRRVIRIPAHDRVREWRDWQAEVLRGIGGGALLIITNGSHESELKPETISKGGIVAINLVSRWQIQGTDWVTELADPLYGTPRMFQLSGDGRQSKIHPSRVICFRGDPIPAGAAVAMEESFWGDSRLLQVWKSVERSDNSKAWFSALVKKAKLLRLGIPGLDDYDEDQLAKRVQVIAEGENSLNAVLYRSSGGGDDPGETVTDYQITWAGIPAVMDAFDQEVAAVSGIPFTRLTGRSPAGMNATGEHDTDNWDKEVASGQKLEVRPCLLQLDPFLIRSAGLTPETTGKDGKPTSITWRFAPLDTPTEQEEAETFDKTMDAVTKLQATGAIPDIAFAKGLQNLMAEREWMPGLDQALGDMPEDERFPEGPSEEEIRAEAEAAALTKAKGGDPASGGGGGNEPPARRAVNDAQPRTLYVRRDVVNVADIESWRTEQGLPPLQDGLHVTICHIDEAFDWMKIDGEWNQDDKGQITIQPGGVRIVEPLGNRTAVLLFTSSPLSWRHEQILRAAQADDKFPQYQPHISLTGEDVDLSKVEPYRGKIVLGPEIFEPVKEEPLPGMA